MDAQKLLVALIGTDARQHTKYLKGGLLVLAFRHLPEELIHLVLSRHILQVSVYDAEVVDDYVG